VNIVLYYAPYTCALAPFVTLTEANAPFEVRAINMRKKEQMSPEYMALNPKHKVPTLVVDGKVLTENVAIHTWVARTYPAAKLLPSDLWQEVQALSLLSWCASGLHPYLSRINSPAKVCDAAGSEDSVKRHATDALMEGFGIADRMLARRDYFFDHFTAPDAHFFWCMRRAGQLGVDLAAFKNCQAHHERMHGRPSVQKVVALEKATLERFAKAA
jgi:glutathione S-transferase